MPEAVRFFAYGSNLDAADLRSFAKAAGLEGAVPHARGRAYLPDHALRFHYRSPARGGGALDVVPAPGGLVPGALLSGGPATAALLDRKEGVRAGRYRRASVVVLTESGRAHAALTYRVRTPEPFHVATTPSYAAACRRGYARFGLDPSPLATAEAGGERSPAAGLFVYGTLREGGSAASRLPGPRRAVRARGRLVDLGDYPGLVPGRGWVTGELLPLPTREATAALFADLDDYEDFHGWDGLATSLYHRGVVRLEGGGVAWTYVLRSRKGAPMPSGDWLGG